MERETPQLQVTPGEAAPGAMSFSRTRRRMEVHVSNTENKQPRFDHQSPAVSGDCRQPAWRDVLATLDEMVESRGIDPVRLEQGAQACLDSLRWPDGVRCPNFACESEDVEAVGDREPMPYLCRRCHRRFSATSATILSRFTLDSLQLLVATYVTVAHHRVVSDRPLAEWLQTDERTAHLMIGLIKKVIAERPSELLAAPTDKGDAPTDGVGDAVALTRRVLAVILGGDPDGSGVAIAATGVEPNWHSVLPLLDPVLQSQREPTLPGMGPRIVPRRLAGPAKKKSKPRQPRTPEPKARGMRPDQLPIPDFEARLRRKRASA